MVTNYVELISLMQKRNCSYKELKFAILLMQKGLTPMEVYNEVFNTTNIGDVSKVIDLQKLLI